MENHKISHTKKISLTQLFKYIQYINNIDDKPIIISIKLKNELYQNIYHLYNIEDKIINSIKRIFNCNVEFQLKNSYIIPLSLQNYSYEIAIQKNKGNNKYYTLFYLINHERQTRLNRIYQFDPKNYIEFKINVDNLII